jgi:predicted Co/Zn/Cd cation transporter (cation efflux family)
MIMTCDIAMSGVSYGLWSRSQLKSYDQVYSNWQNDLTTLAKVLNWYVLKILIKNSKYEISQKSVHWEFKLFHVETDLHA